ncbi:MAG: PEP-CTERM sorting domain-containing protein [Caldimonas sp.]
MRKTGRSALAAAGIGAALTFLAVPAGAQVFGGVTFPGGISSFADAMTEYAPNIVAGEPGLAYRNGGAALGAPNYGPGNTECPTAAACPYVSLSDGGALTLEFVDNRLTGSGNTNLDLWVFEIGPDVEDTFVAISKDGVEFFSVGKVFGATAGIDIDAFGFGIGDQFRFIRLIDDTNDGAQSGITVGADIDAVGAISTVATPAIPEPETWALMMLGVAALGARRRLAALRRAKR